MITIDLRRCTGCGACVEVCPTGALYLVDGKAAVDDALCRECEACLAACPQEAIRLVDDRVSAAEPVRMPVPRPGAEVVRIETASTPPAVRARVLPALGAVLVWTAREIMPWLTEVFLDRLDRQATLAARRGTGAAGRGGSGAGQGASGRRHRHRRRAGGRPN